VARALAGTRGIADAAVAVTASAMAIRPALINRFIGVSSTAHRGNYHKFLNRHFVPCLLPRHAQLLKIPTRNRFALQAGLPFLPESSGRPGTFLTDVNY
jgi:hypothetical protein